jgi:hypothetical protein
MKLFCTGQTTTNCDILGVMVNKADVGLKQKEYNTRISDFELVPLLDYSILDHLIAPLAKTRPSAPSNRGLSDLKVVNQASVSISISLLSCDP